MRNSDEATKRRRDEVFADSATCEFRFPTIRFRVKCAIFLLPTLCLLLAACGDERDPAEIQRLADSLRERSATTFTVADYLRPRTQGIDGFNYYLAPLFFIDLSNGGAPRRFGAVRREAGAWVADPARPTVYLAESSIWLNGREHRQLTFVWAYPGADGGRPALQGTRLTLDQDDFPIITEVLADTTGLRPIAVSQRFEQAAAEQFGPAPPGRIYAAETDFEAQSDLVVTRVLKDGGEPMGPILYLDGGSTDVLTLHCRCSDSQIRELHEEIDYHLVPMAELEAMGIAPPDWSVDGAALEDRLRVPNLP